MPELRDPQLQRPEPGIEAAVAGAVRMMSFVKPCDPSSTLDVRGTLASGQALGAIDSYPVGRADLGALCTASKRWGDGIQLRASGLAPQRLHDHASTPDVAGPSPRDGLSGRRQVAEGRSLAPAGTRPWVA